jgi:hypothetical protein
MSIDKQDPSDKTQTSDTSASDQVSDKLQDASRGGGPSAAAVQAAQNLTGTKLIEDIMAWQTQVTSLPAQTDPNGNVVAFNTKEWNEEHYEKADKLHKQIPGRMQVFGAKTHLTNKNLGKIKTIMDMEDKSST